MLKRIYDKSKILFAVMWIIAYCVLMSAADALSAAVGMEKSVTLAIGLGLSVVLFVFLKKHALLAEYGFCRSGVPARSMLYYIPVCLMLSANLWYGVTCHYGITETVLYILSMFCVGFLEEVIFRGLLFGAMRRDSLQSAIIVCSITFGIGHIINLFNGSGAELLPNLLQVVYAAAAGLMFVMLFLKTGSIVGCIVIHGIFNALSAFADDSAVTPGRQILTCVLLTVITGGYALYLAQTMKRS